MHKAILLNTNKILYSLNYYYWAVFDWLDNIYIGLDSVQ